MIIIRYSGVLINTFANEITMALRLSGVNTLFGVFTKLSCVNKNPFWDFLTEF
jgi:hypothetical protein